MVIVNIRDLGTMFPTQMELTDSENNKYYFRLRNGYASLTDLRSCEIILEDIMIDGIEGICGIKEVVEWLNRHNIKVDETIDET